MEQQRTTATDDDAADSYISDDSYKMNEVLHWQDITAFNFVGKYNWMDEQLSTLQQHSAYQINLPLT